MSALIILKANLCSVIHTEKTNKLRDKSYLGLVSLSCQGMIEDRNGTHCESFGESTLKARSKVFSCVCSILGEAPYSLVT